MKYFYLMLIVLASNIAFAQNYNNIVNYSINSTPVHGVKIKTNLPFTPGSQMPTINITGYNFDSAQTVNLTIVYYIYSDANDFYNPANYFFYYPTMSSSGAYTPRVLLSAENGKVVIFIDDKIYYQRFTLSAYAQGMSEVPAWFEGWTTADEALTGVKTVEIPYKNRFKGDVNFGGDGIWNGNGYVGIGTTTPIQLFNVQGKSGIPAVSGSVQNGIAAFSSYDTYSTLYIGNSILPPYAMWLQASSRYELSGSHPIALNPNGGNVGIGTISPTDMLTVAGNISAREIKISTNAGADFVFEPNYKLPDLAELEKFVKANKHLPEIPSANQMVNRGVNLGEMNIKLLQKVE